MHSVRGPDGRVKLIGHHRLRTVASASVYRLPRERHAPSGCVMMIAGDQVKAPIKQKVIELENVPSIFLRVQVSTVSHAFSCRCRQESRDRIRRVTTCWTSSIVNSSESSSLG